MSAEAKKRAILQFLANGDEAPCRAIAKAVRGLPGATLDVVLNCMESAGFIAGTPPVRNVQRFYSITDAGRAAL